MKKYSFLITSALTASLLLAACGSTDEATPVEDNTTGTVTESTETAKSTNENENEGIEAETTTLVETPEVETIEDDNKEKPTSTETTTPESKPEAEAEAETTTNSLAASAPSYVTSPEQNYEIVLQNGFTLTAEEPGRDMVISNENDYISMRIETFAKTDTTYEEMAQLAKETIEVTAPEGKYETVAVTDFLAQNANILNAVAYKIVYPDDAEQTVTVVFENADKIVQLTVFDTTAETYTNQLLNMGFTIR